MSINTNVRPSGVVKPIGLIAPQSVNGPASSAWVRANMFHKHAALVALGVQLGAVVTAEQSKLADGSNPKALTINGAANKTYVDGDDNTSAVLDLDPLDVSGGFEYFRVTITTGGAGLVTGVVLGVGPRYEAPNATT